MDQYGRAKSLDLRQEKIWGHAPFLKWGSRFSVIQGTMTNFKTFLKLTMTLLLLYNLPVYLTHIEWLNPYIHIIYGYIFYYYWAFSVLNGLIADFAEKDMRTRIHCKIFTMRNSHDVLFFLWNRILSHHCNSLWKITHSTSPV